MNRSKGIIPALAVVLIIIGFFVWAITFKDNYREDITEKIQKEKSKADVIFKAATLAEIVDGIKYWELIAKDAAINKSTGTAKLVTVDGLFYDSGKPTVKFLAPSATWMINNNEIYLVDPIGYDIKSEKIIKGELAKVKDRSKLFSIFNLPVKAGKAYEGYWFQAKNLNWKLATKKLVCTGAISLTKGNAVMSAEKLEADVGLEKVRLTGNPTAEIIADPEKISITAKEFNIDSTTDTIIAEKDVVISRGAARILTGRSEYFQDKDIVQLSGYVNITENEIAAFARTALYDIKGTTIVLNDNAKATRGGNAIYGEKMTIFLGSNKIIVEGGTKATIKEAEIK